jgi:hypothetical protein
MRTLSVSQQLLTAVGLASLGLVVVLLLAAPRQQREPLASPAAAEAHARHPGKLSGVLVEETNLQRMAEAAGAIVRARVVEVREERHPEFENLELVAVTLEVRESIKGGVTGLYTFRQHFPDPQDRGTMLGYQVGQDLVLLLTRPSRYGLSSPVGLEQSVFSVEVDRENRPWARNGMDNRGLFEGMRERITDAQGELDALTFERLREHRQGPMRYEDFREALRILGAASQGRPR